MNRTLRRPMFRMGGSAEGITSGLDMPKTNASRQGYDPGGNVMPESDGYKSPLGLKFTEMDLSKFKNMSDNQLASDYDMSSRYKRAMDFIKSKQSPRSNNLNDFLISMGLDLVSRPTSGNIFADVATSAKGPFAEMQAAKRSRAAEQDKLSQALIGDIMDQMSTEKKTKLLADTDIEAAKIAAQAKIDAEKIKAESGTDQDKFAFELQQRNYTKLIKTQRELEDQKNALIKQKPTAEQISAPANEFAPIPTDTTEIDAQIEQIDRQLEDNAKLQALYSDAEKDLTRQALLKAIGNGQYTFEDLIVYDQTGQLPTEESGFATGGRVGLQMGGEPMQASMNMDQAPAAGITADSVQKLSFEELRSRLPNSITNDIVTLIANSEQALVDFANIQTQQDVNAFNQKYEVSLQMPAEA